MRGLLFAVSALALLPIATAASARVGVAGDPVLYWNEVLLDTLVGDPTVQSRSAAMVDVALHDAVNATLGSPNHSYLGAVASGGDTRAAASVAAHDVLVNLYPTKTASLDAALTASLALVPNGAAKTSGMATGAAYASAVIANRAHDGSDLPSVYTPTGAPGNYQPTPPLFIPGVDQQYANVTPWLMTSTSQFRPGPPPALGSAEYAAAFNEVKAIGSATSATRTADQTNSAQFWATDEGPGIFTRIAIDTAAAAGKTTLENADLFATLMTGVADASITAFNSKYYYAFWRPVTAVRLGDTDGNAATAADASWTPLLFTPPFPSYLSAGTVVNETGFNILDHEFGNTIAFCGKNSFGERCFASFEDAAADFGNSRVWGGIHFSFDSAAGISEGRALGQYAFDSGMFGAVPEPSTWALIIGGFATVGVACRRRRRSAVCA
jgi:hypothetical protein